MTRDPHPAVADPRVLAPGFAPTPFTADEIRRGCPAGRSVRLLVETEGEQPFLRVNRFLDCDDDGALIEQSRSSLEGEPIGEPASARAAWTHLQAHASFPADRTSIEPDVLETPLGTLRCLRYHVVNGSTVDTFWFAHEHPGMPVKYRTERNGHVVATVTMLASGPE